MLSRLSLHKSFRINKYLSQQIIRRAHGANVVTTEIDKNSKEYKVSFDSTFQRLIDVKLSFQIGKF